MMQKVLFIINPNSGSGEMRQDLMECLDIFCKAGFETTVYLTQCTQDAEHLVRENAHRFDRIVCAGGDGTLDEVVNGMMALDTRPPIGYLPAGTTNDFARSLQIPPYPEDAAKIAAFGKPFLIDVGKCNDRYFTYIAAFGAFTGVSYSTPQPYKSLFGHTAYVLEGIRALPAIKAYQTHVVGDGVEVTGSFIYGMVTNATMVGGVFSVSEDDVQMDDGLFEVLLIRQPENAVQLQGIINLLLAQNMDSDMIVHFKSAAVSMEMQEAVCWTLDGEFGGKLQTVQIENQRQAITLLTPQDYGETL